LGRARAQARFSVMAWSSMARLIGGGKFNGRGVAAKRVLSGRVTCEFSW